MRTITKDELKEILAKHLKWLHHEFGGERANLRCADLSYANLRCADLSSAYLSSADLRYANLSSANLRYADLSSANLRYADLRYANLSSANLSSADLRSANLRYANLSSANLSWADLRSANLSWANLRYANLSSADLRCADLSYANLRYANLSWADLSSADLSSAKIELELINRFYPIACPETGSFIGWKKCAENKIVKLEILADAKRSSAFTRKCRCSAAKVLAIENIDGSESCLTEIKSIYDTDFIYKLGEIVTVDNFDEDRRNECSTGIHFFITRQEAVDY